MIRPRIYVTRQDAVKTVKGRQKEWEAFALRFLEKICYEIKIDNARRGLGICWFINEIKCSSEHKYLQTSKSDNREIMG